MVVVFPAPLGPRNPNTSPVPTSRSMPRTASSAPYCMRRSRTSIAEPVKKKQWYGRAASTVPECVRDGRRRRPGCGPGCAVLVSSPRPPAAGPPVPAVAGLDE